VEKLEIKTTLIIPVLNEIKSITLLLDSIRTQSITPNQIIIVDAGSVDGTQLSVQKWWDEFQWKGTELELIDGANSYPGRARNLGVQSSKHDWVVFIDAGIVPNVDWIECLMRCALSNPLVPASFGLCLFEPDDIVSTAVASVSYGLQVKHLALPASIFHKSIFDSIGYFREDLRAAEDHEWFARFKISYGELPICEKAVVHYREIPNSYRVVFSKWRRAAYFSCLAKTKKLQAFFYSLLPVILVAFSFINLYLILSLIIIYFLIRGIILPLRKNGLHLRPISLKLLFNIFISVVVIDSAKSLGFVSGLIKIYLINKVDSMKKI